MKLIRLAFSPEVSLIISIIVFVASIGLVIGKVLSLFGQDEPPLIYHMSAVALIVGAYASIQACLGRKETADAQS